MASFNKVILLGYLTDTPELKHNKEGIAVTTFRIGVGRKFAKEGTQQVDFITIICWRAAAEFVTRNFTKGDAVMVCGELRTRVWTDGHNTKHYVTEVVADEVSYAERKVKAKEADVPTPQFNQPLYSSGGEGFEDLAPDDELPF